MVHRCTRAFNMVLGIARRCWAVGDCEDPCRSELERVVSSYSVTPLSFARPFSKSGPIMLSMLLKTPITRVTSVFGPVIVQVTLVASPVGFSSNAVVLLDLNGFRNSSAIRTLEGSTASMISIDPSPALRFPDQEYPAPTPEFAPE